MYSTEHERVQPIADVSATAREKAKRMNIIHVLGVVFFSKLENRRKKLSRKKEEVKKRNKAENHMQREERKIDLLTIRKICQDIAI